MSTCLSTLRAAVRRGIRPILAAALAAALPTGAGPLAAQTAAAQAADRPPMSGPAVLQAMHDRWAPTRWKTLTFVQRTTFPQRGVVETWYETAAPPHLRIDIAPLDSGRTLLLRGDSAYVLWHGAVDRAVPNERTLSLMLRGHLAQPPAVTADTLRRRGFDLEQTARATWQGRPAIVVGAAGGDTTVPQFWVDAEHLYLVRLIQRSANGTVTDIHVAGHRLTDESWIETLIDIHRGGVLIQREEYSDIRPRAAVDPRVFDPHAGVRPAWVEAAAACTGPECTGRPNDRPDD